MKYFLAFLACVALIVGVFILVLRGFSGPKAAPQAPLTDYTSTNTVMRYTIDGPITADEQHRAIRISVSRSESRIEVIQGYQGNVIAAKSYPSNEDAYGNFLRSLQLLGFTKGDPDENKADERGVCPTTRRFTYEIVSGATVLQHYWKGVCGGGTFDGNATTVQTLFIQQIPEYSTFTSGTNL